MNISCPSAKAAASAGDAVFLEEGDSQTTFRQFHDRVQALAMVLKRSHAAADSPLLLPVSQTSDSLIRIFAAIKAGFVAVPIDAGTPYSRVTELCGVLGLQRLQRHPPAVQHGHRNAEATPESCDGDSPVLGIFTSGSSGVPKLVLHAWRSLLGNAKASNEWIPLPAGSRTLLSLPLYHIGGFAQALRAMISQTTVVMGARVEDAHRLHALKISHCSMVSTQLQRLLGNMRPLPNLQAVLLGGGPCSTVLLQQGMHAGVPLRPTYGMSEAASQIVTSGSDGAQRVLPGVEVGFSKQGEILLKGRNLFLGYWRNSSIDPQRDHNGWFHTRDLGEWHEGRLRLLGRLDNQFVSGGKNIQPEEIERLIRSYPGVKDAVVVPVPHREFGHTGFAFVALQQGGVDEAFTNRVIGWLKQRLPGYLVPRYYGALPAESGGLKPNRVQLIQEAARLLT